MQGLTITDMHAHTRVVIQSLYKQLTSLLTKILGEQSRGGANLWPDQPNWTMLLQAQLSRFHRWSLGSQVEICQCLQLRQQSTCLVCLAAYSRGED